MTKTMLTCKKCGKEFNEREFDFFFNEHVCSECDQQWREQSKKEYEERQKKGESDFPIKEPWW